MWEQTCVAAPAQQRSNRPKRCSSPNADEWHAYGVYADTVRYKHTHGNVAWIQLQSTNYAVWNVRALAITGQKKWEALNVAAFLTLDLWMSRLWHLLNNKVFPYVNSLCKHLQLKGTSVDKENQSACFISERCLLTYLMWEAASSAIVAIFIININLLHDCDLLFVVFVFLLLYIYLCCADYVEIFQI